MYHTDGNCQQISKIDPLILGIMNEKNAIALKLLDHIIYLSTRFTTVFIAQGTLAAKFGVTREWVNKLLARWKELGVIKYRQKDFNRSCIYYLSPLLNQEKNRIKFQLPAAQLLFAVSSLTSAIFSQVFTLSNNKENIYKHNQQQLAAFHHGYPPENKTTPLFISQTTKLLKRSSTDELTSNQSHYVDLRFVKTTRGTVEQLLRTSTEVCSCGDGSAESKAQCPF